MSQVNIKRSLAFQTPPSGSLGIGFDSNGNPCRINEDGSTTLIPINTEDESTGLTTNVIAHRGVGLEADLPAIFNQGDIYVTTDSLKIYTAIDADTWNAINIVVGQFITDLTTGIIYQYNGFSLFKTSQPHGKIQFDYINADLDPLAGGFIEVGNVLQHKSLFLEYDILSDSIHENGTMVLNNRNNTEVDRTKIFESSGFVFTKSIASNVIRLSYPINNALEASNMSIIIKRILI
jgi:hypothetical protein